MRKRPSTVLTAVHVTAEGLHRAGVMNQVTLRQLKQFCLRLSRPAAPNDRLRRTMRTKPPWNP